MHAPALAVRVPRRMKHAPSYAEIAAQLADNAAALALELTGTKPTSSTAVEWRFRNKGSLSIHVAGPKRGRFYDNEAGVYGDALRMVAHLRNFSISESYRLALYWLGVSARQEQPRDPAPLRREQSPQRQSEADPGKTQKALRLWLETVPAMNSPVSTYLASRGLALPPDAPLRYHPACPGGAERLPAMVALMINPFTGVPSGILRTFLLPNGSGKAPGEAKMMLGLAGTVRLVPDSKVTLGLGITEGIETALAVIQRAGWTPVWVATSAGAIKHFPVLPGIECLTIFADADAKGTDAARECGRRWVVAGREAHIRAPLVGDWADALPRTWRAA